MYLKLILSWDVIKKKLNFRICSYKLISFIFAKFYEKSFTNEISRKDYLITNQFNKHVQVYVNSLFLINSILSWN